MQRILVASVSAVVAVALLGVGACDDGDQVACKVETDCPQGTICRDGICGAVGVEAGTPFDASVSPACATEGATCNAPDECCSRICTESRCASSTPPPASTCRGLFELCQNDCCAGLTCISGACR